MPGTVVTFYSYKGGVGRSFTTANIAVLLARWGYRVLCVDWDLEAPGLPDYFRPLLGAEPAAGVVDLVDDFLAGASQPGAHITRLIGEGGLDLLAAGRADARYVGRVQGIDWEGLYERGFGEYLEECRQQWITDYDFVLLDSRTGVSDIGGICTAHLPDRLVVLYTANLQSVQGAVDIAQRANEARDRLPYDRPRLTVLPILSRFDSREEYNRAEEWRRICLDETKGLYHDWLHQAVSPDAMARQLTLPYVSYWSFGEQLPVRDEPRPGPDQISYALETVAAVVAHDFDRTDLLAENRDAYVGAVRSKKHQFRHGVRVSCPRSTLDIAAELVKALGELDVRANLSLSGDRTLLTRAEDDARHLCLVVDREMSRWQSAELELFLHRTVGQDRRVMPVLTERTDARVLPGYVRNLQYLRLGPSLGPAEVAREIAGQLAGGSGSSLLDLLRQTTRARLRPARWFLVDEILRDLFTADDATADELAADLALAIRPRGHDDDRVPAPPGVRRALESAVKAHEEATLRKESGRP
ncbi:tyrosine-protein kinase family protein [Amycolatopsis pithecellobii]|uniref:AAA family ATPase n=1 Tax=Amycolatopsis pithecellobii TaxID=664692 RepID=A0A6N7Z1K3_9PSEU|nr:AAA family ATPase [Amycolatopsis pithecellobii]MTD58252.1 AAA family ATPase [Amycolatopsis pithecellobii]